LDKKQVRYSYSHSAGDAAQQADTTAPKKENNGVPKKGDTAVANDESRERPGTLLVHVAAVQAEYGNAFIGHELAHVVRTPAVRAMQVLA
jgi:hypothetical protein